MHSLLRACAARPGRLASALGRGAAGWDLLRTCSGGWTGQLRCFRQTCVGQQPRGAPRLLPSWRLALPGTGTGCGPTRSSLPALLRGCSGWQQRLRQLRTAAGGERAAGGRPRAARAGRARQAKGGLAAASAGAAGLRLASAASAAAASAGASAGADVPVMTAAARLLQGLMFVGLAIAAVHIVPNMGQNSAEQAVQLLNAREPFLQRSGAARVRRLAAGDAAAHAMLAERAPARLLALLAADADAGVAEAAVDALAALCRLEEGREACVLAGAVDALQDALQGEWVQGMPARARAGELLATLTIQRDHLE